MKLLRIALPVALLMGVLLLLAGCESNSTTSRRSSVWEKELGAVMDTPQDPKQAHQDLNIKVDLIPKGKYGRRIFREMAPQYITIHSTQNYTGDAYDHAKALNRGALRGGVIGYLCWHFTVQDDVVIQHIPTDERGEHADFDGPGNRYSIGIEMCEHTGNSQTATMERTAKLAASLMYYHNIPIDNIRAHYHWPRQGYSTPNKNCPHFLMENGMPGDTWRWFVGRVNRHHQRLIAYDEMIEEQKRLEEEQRRQNSIVQRVWERISTFLRIG